MTEQSTPPTAENTGHPSTPPTPAPAVGHGMAPLGAVGRVRSTGVCIALAVCTLGIYTIVWYFRVHQEMKRHTGTGLGGGVALLLALLISIVMPYVTSSEVGNLYTRRGKPAPVSGATGLWYFPGSFILVGPIVWFVKTNGALNAYWRSQGAA